MKITPNVGALLGFARKGGILLSGEAAVESGLKRGRIALVILASDLSEKRLNNWKKWCQDIGVQYLVLGSKEEIGNILGMSRGILGITDGRWLLPYKEMDK